MDRVICKHCWKPGKDHGLAENPHRPFACPSDKPFPKWPSTIKDEVRAGKVYDKRVSKYWMARTTTFEARV